MDLRHHFRQLKLIAERSVFAFQLRKAVPFFKQQIKSSSVIIIYKVQTTTLKQFYNVFLGQLRPGVKYSFNYSFHGRGLHISTFSNLMDTFTKPLIIQFGHPRFN